MSLEELKTPGSVLSLCQCCDNKQLIRHIGHVIVLADQEISEIVCLMREISEIIGL